MSNSRGGEQVTPPLAGVSTGEPMAGVTDVDLEAGATIAGELAGASGAGEVAGSPAAGAIAGSPMAGESAGTPAAGEVAGTPAAGEVAGVATAGEIAGAPAAGEVTGGAMAGELMGGMSAHNRGPCAESGACPDISWVTIPAGSFEMGSADHYAAERPVHLVTLESFELSATEVTVGQYRACVESGACPPPVACSANTTWTEQAGGRESFPVNCLSWGQARTFALWVGADLPTEAEWEYAARAGTSFSYAGSALVDEVAWYQSNSMGTALPVALKLPNPFGLYDMSGNVREWTLDEWSDDYSDAPSNGNSYVGSLPPCMTRCADGTASRVTRGGAWGHVEDNLRVSHRGRSGAATLSDYHGVRLRRVTPLP